jgi:hypothetical protein
MRCAASAQIDLRGHRVPAKVILASGAGDDESAGEVLAAQPAAAVDQEASAGFERADTAGAGAAGTVVVQVARPATAVRSTGGRRFPITVKMDLKFAAVITAIGLGASRGLAVAGVGAAAAPVGLR